VTRPVVWDGGQLCVSADAAGGSVRVAIVGEDRLGLDRCVPITANVTDSRVHWRNGARPERMRGRKVQLQFEVRDATVYAFSFVGN
jgi:hypothetical protein